MVEIPLIHELEGGARSLRLREPTFADLIDAGDVTTTKSTRDDDRRTTTETTTFDPWTFSELLAALAGVPADVADTLSLADLRRIRPAIERMIGAEPDVIRDAADALVFDLEWAPDVVERMTTRRLAYWLKRAIAHRKRQST